MSHAQLSVQLYTVREALSGDLPGTLKRIADLGFTNVELYGFADRADEYSELLPGLGLSAPTGHARLVGEDLAPIFAAAKKIGITTVIDPHIDRELWTTRDDVANSAAQINEIAAAGAAEGLTIGYHNHWWETENLIEGKPALEVFAEYLDPAVILEVDTYWAEVGGAPAAALLERLGSRVTAIHVKDGAVNQNDKEQVAVGSGKIGVLDILAAAPEALRVVELDDFDGDVFDALRDSYAYLTANDASLRAVTA
ncbi:sugar phosphate isomerase/epimerase [Glaciihabitans sp. dw_435]|uniref:sugar phosphate isomerase/epimerase family protein n=1 Tax=Glaciihabitans sp. dw_435 TaxID=2720081 RepID=UPI001BD5E05E|nr:sugar phosphate isomerase/epimerase [Glaciihabitans sp. dw_435]